MQIHRVGPQPQGGPLCDWSGEQQRRPQEREPSKCLMGGAMKKDWPKRPPERQLQEAQGKTDRAVTPVVEAVHIPAHLALPGSLKAKQLCYLHAQLSLGQSCHRPKNVSCLCMQAHFQFSSVTQSCQTLCDPMNCSTPGLPVHHQLLAFTQTHIHRVGDAIQPSHPLSFPSPPAPNPSQHQGLFQWVNSSHEVAKVLEF